MSVDDMIRILNDQIEMRKEIIVALEKNRNPCWSCGLTTNQITHLVDWVHWKEAEK